VPLQNKEAVGVNTVLKKNWIFQFGFPEAFFTDPEAEFSKLKDLAEHHICTPAHHASIGDS